MSVLAQRQVRTDLPPSVPASASDPDAVQWREMPGPRDDDHVLLQALRQSQDPEVRRRLCSQLLERYHRRIAVWCLRLTGDREEAADLAQDVCVKVFRSLQSFRGQARFSTWLYAITRNHCLNYLKSARKRKESWLEDLGGELIDGTGGRDFEKAEARVRARWLLEVMERTLTAAERRVVVLHYVQEMPLQVVTRLLKLENQSGAKAYIVSARRKLKRELSRLQAVDDARLRRPESRQ